MPESGQMKDRFPKRLTRDRSAVNANASDHVVPFDNGHAFAELCRGDRAFLAGGPTADYDEVVP
jgi:hypothetical protein